MGLFLGLAGIIGVHEETVVDVLANFAQTKKGICRKEVRSTEDDDTLVVAANTGNVSVLFPSNFMEWTEASKDLSGVLKKCVFSFHIHDGDLWMYDLFQNGERIDGFNPLPDYWDEDISAEERESYKGNVEILCQCVPGLQRANVERYLVNWDLDDDAPAKAYPDDKSPPSDWQMVDFMKKLGLCYPLDDKGQLLGTTYLFKTSDS